MKKCPKCKEEIADKATRCKHCNADLRSWFLRHKFLSLVFVIIIIAIISGIAGGGKEESAKTEPAKTVYATGETIQLKNHTLVVSDVNKDYKSGNQFDNPQDSNNSYVVMTVAITNTGSSDELAVNDWGFKLEDETGTQRSTTIGGIADGKLQSVTLAKDGKTSGKIVFEAKKNSSTLKLHYSPGIFGGDDITVNL